MSFFVFYLEVGLALDLVSEIEVITAEEGHGPGLDPETGTEGTGIKITVIDQNLLKSKCL